MDSDYFPPLSLQIAAPGWTVPDAILCCVILCILLILACAIAAGGRALFVERHVHKGSLVYVEGKIRTRSYDDASGNKRYITEIYADRIEFFSLGGRRPQDAEHAGDSSVATQPADAAAEVHAFAAKSEPTPTTSASDLEPISPADADPVDDLPF